MTTRSSTSLFLGALVAICFFATPPVNADSVFDDAVAYWAFEGAGDTILDSKGIADMAIADGSSPTRITGLVGGGLQVNPGDQLYATTGVDVDALDFNRQTYDAFTVAGWVKQYEGSPVFIKMQNSDPYRGWHLEVKDTGEINFLLRSTNLETDKIAVIGDGRIPMGEWVHLAASFSYDVNDALLGVRLYVNGSQFASYVQYDGLADWNPYEYLDTTNSVPFQFTARETREYLDYYETSYDEVVVWNRILSQAEVQQLVNAGVPDVPVTNYIANGNFENTTGWVAAGTGVLPPEGWESHIWKNNAATQATGAAAVGGTGNSALMEGELLSGIDQRGMAQSFVHPTDAKWQFDMDFATETPSDHTQRTVAMTLRTNNGAQLAFIVSDPDNDGLGDLLVGGVGGYVAIAGLENKIVFDTDLSDVTDSVHHLRITGHFNDATPNYDITLTDPYGLQYTVLGLTDHSDDMGELLTGAGIGQVGFYTYKSYGDWLLDNVSLVDINGTTLPGDADHSGSVGPSDAAILAQYWLIATGATWEMGDFNGDGAVNDLDASILAANWGAGTVESAVPEPSTLVLLIGLALGLIARQRRQHVS
ncbi:MAG: PEP-CTERM sorting domain-containing protein [Pirellulales bacterium]|nr:PEP-CTERM sorting domain-containing protein [Pirellulales bacterium]